jgi:transposase
LVRPEETTGPMTGKRKHCTAEFKAKIALEALCDELTVAAKHSVHQMMIEALCDELTVAKLAAKHSVHQMMIEALCDELTVAKLAAKHSVHQMMISGWKRQAMEGLSAVFSGRAEAKRAVRNGDVEKLRAKTGQLLTEQDFLVFRRAILTP